ncbi:histidine ammonia-lyase [Burkholderia cenocepacia]|uniref:histidine ammonia-lyase n=1 Tax=Burkholderia cenocepacia TaxID=95486 RepID=UPI001B97783E|nr:histidine ammonia-lyase [Burkholderia cenocepacia]MBR8043524.1 histidine ammonia-lyase [Burkholderia cenocepacia]MBR8329518.1 histidine ammonia-lyase [Burkholderia cenocepacia]
MPELPVLVALAGPLRFDNVTLSAVAGQPYDWRPVAALNVEVFASAGVPWSDLLRTLADIAAAVPDTLVLSFREGPRVHCGEAHVVPGQDFALFDWFPMAIAPICWPASHVLARRLFDVLGDTIPNTYDDACNLAMQVVAEAHENAKEVA